MGKFEEGYKAGYRTAIFDVSKALPGLIDRAERPPKGDVDDRPAPGILTKAEVDALLRSADDVGDVDDWQEPDYDAAYGDDDA